MKTLSDAVGENIKNLRLAHKPKKMSRERLAELVGVDVGTIWRWETGKSFPEGKNIEAVAKVFGVSPAAISGKIEFAAAPTPEELDATVAHQARKIHALEQEVASLKSDPAHELQRKLVQLKQEYGKLASEWHDKEKDLKAKLKAANDKIDSLLKGSPNPYPEFSRVLNYPEVLERVLALIRNWEDQEGLTPSVRKLSQD